ncbi:MAG: hypothetical protein NT051_02525 [Candidatus Micrarchaeota archaeon]|nr:hypothetical protein [Candidatus Micrarchaeota archaeon]
MKGSIPETKIGLTMRPNGLGKNEWIAEPKAADAVEVEKKAKKKPEKKE